MMAVITMITLMTAGIPDTFTHNTHTCFMSRSKENHTYEVRFM
jgi:hypothetical protein